MLVKCSVFPFYLASLHASLVPRTFSNINKTQGSIAAAVGISTCVVIVMLCNQGSPCDNQSLPEGSSKEEVSVSGDISGSGGNSGSPSWSPSSYTYTASPQSSPTSFLSRSSSGETRDTDRQTALDAKPEADANEIEDQEDQIANLQSRLQNDERRIKELEAKLADLRTGPQTAQRILTPLRLSTVSDTSVGATQDSQTASSHPSCTATCAVGKGNGKGSKGALATAPVGKGPGEGKGPRAKSNDDLVPVGGSDLPTVPALDAVAASAESTTATASTDKPAGTVPVTSVSNGKGQGKGKGPVCPNKGKGKGKGTPLQNERPHLCIIALDAANVPVAPNAHVETDSKAKPNSVNQFPEKFLQPLEITVKTAPRFSPALAKWIRENLNIADVEQSLVCISKEIREKLREARDWNYWLNNEHCQRVLREAAYHNLSLISQDILKSTGDKLIDNRGSKLPSLSDLLILLKESVDKPDLISNNTDLMRGALGVVSAFTAFTRKPITMQPKSEKVISLDGDLKSMSLEKASQGTSEEYNKLVALLEENKNFTSGDQYFFLKNIQELANITSDVTGFVLNEQSTPSASVASGADPEQGISAELQTSELECLNIKYQELITEENKATLNTKINTSELISECIKEGVVLSEGTLLTVLASEAIAKSEDINLLVTCNKFSPKILALYASVNNLNQGSSSQCQDWSRAFTAESIKREMKKVLLSHNQIDKQGRDEWLVCNHVSLRLNIKDNQGVKDAKKILERFAAVQAYFTQVYNEWIAKYIGYFAFINRQDIVTIGQKLCDFTTQEPLDALLFEESCCKFFEECKSIKKYFDSAAIKVCKTNSAMLQIIRSYQKIKDDKERVAPREVYAQCKMFIDKATISAQGYIEGNANLYGYLLEQGMNGETNRQLINKEAQDFIDQNNSSTAPEFQALRALAQKQRVELVG